jgi:hypothetical protein
MLVRSRPVLREEAAESEGGLHQGLGGGGCDWWARAGEARVGSNQGHRRE